MSGEDKYTPLPDLVTKIVDETYSISASEVQKLAPMDQDSVFNIINPPPPLLPSPLPPILPLGFFPYDTIYWH